jgi:hypothetical protein
MLVIYGKSDKKTLYRSNIDPNEQLFMKNYQFLAAMIRIKEKQERDDRGQERILIFNHTNREQG